MISPNFATMLCFVQTDAVVPAETCDLLLGVCVKRSFDRISVDGQLSTNDTAILMASGASGVTVAPESDDELRFGEALDYLLRRLAILGQLGRRGDVDRDGHALRAKFLGGGVAADEALVHQRGETLEDVESLSTEVLRFGDQDLHVAQTGETRASSQTSADAVRRESSGSAYPPSSAVGGA